LAATASFDDQVEKLCLAVVHAADNLDNAPGTGFTAQV
jgi:hypothetical protein